MCVAVPRRVIDVDADRVLADIDGVPTWMRRAGVAGVQSGDYVLVYAGHVVDRLSPKEAEDILTYYAGLETSV